MIGKRMESWARSTNIIRARGYPFMCSGHIDKLVLVEGSEREASWSSLSLLQGRILLLEVTVECLRVFEGSSTLGADSHGRGCHRQVCHRQVCHRQV